MIEKQSNLNTLTNEEFCLEEVCEITLLSAETIIEIVGHGVVEPNGENPGDWRFDTSMLAKTKKAVRLRNDLEIDWPGIALALSLIDELQELRETNRALEQRINRFTNGGAELIIALHVQALIKKLEESHNLLSIYRS